jgi:hypothetical protein|tara:strand:- start:603 stop:758 length:156 start_codon:yes stop_codon:yes gene_type:complete
MSLLNKLTAGSDLSKLNGGTPKLPDLSITKLQDNSVLDREAVPKYVDNKPQ